MSRSPKKIPRGAVAAIEHALARWSDPETMRGIRVSSFSRGIRQYAGVLVPGCFYKGKNGGYCFLDDCGKDACQRECEYLLEVRTILAQLKRKGISITGAQKVMIDEALENLEIPDTTQTCLGDWP